MNLSGVDNIAVIESNPQIIYEGCAAPGRLPLLFSFSNWLKRLLNG
jgi:hypothetical protein